MATLPTGPTTVGLPSATVLPFPPQACPTEESAGDGALGQLVPLAEAVADPDAVHTDEEILAAVLGVLLLRRARATCWILDEIEILLTKRPSPYYELAEEPR